MSTKTLVDRIEPWAKGWERSSGTKNILQLVEDAQDELFDYDSPGMVFIPSDNKGFEPYLKTVDGTYEYEIKNANLSSNITKTLNSVAYDARCRRVLDIFVDVTKNTYEIRYEGPSWFYSMLNPYSPRTTEKVEMASIPFDFYPPTETDNAKVVFKDNPGTTTDVFFIRFIVEPPRLTSEAIPLMVPQSFYQGIIEYCIGQVQFFANGKYNEMMQRWESYWKPKFRAEMSWSSGVQGSLVEPIIC